MKMTPRTIVAHLHYLERDIAEEQAELFNIVRAAMHADQQQAEAFLRQISPSEPEQDDLPDWAFSPAPAAAADEKAVNDGQ